MCLKDLSSINFLTFEFKQDTLISQGQTNKILEFLGGIQADSLLCTIQPALVNCPIWKAASLQELFIHTAVFYF